VSGMRLQKLVNSIRKMIATPCGIRSHKFCWQYDNDLIAINVEEFLVAPPLSIPSQYLTGPVDGTFGLLRVQFTSQVTPEQTDAPVKISIDSLLENVRPENPYPYLTLNEAIDRIRAYDAQMARRCETSRQISTIAPRLVRL
jgi:hypothetical protein